MSRSISASGHGAVSRALSLAALGSSFVLSVGCSQGTESGAAASASAVPTGSALVLAAVDDAATPDTSSSAKAATAPIVPIPAGRFDSGSAPGDRGRDPRVEPALVPVELTAFDIDRFLYPNEEGAPPMLGATRDKAASLCRARGRRLCTELEWERACKGPEGQPFAGRNGWDPACSKAPATCASGFGVLGMGAVSEWTSSDVVASEDVKRGAALRGAPENASSLDRRCAHRASSSAEGTSGVGFRCCGGDPNGASIARIERRTSFEKAELPPSELGALFSAVPQLAKLGTDLRYFEREPAAREVTSRADAGVDPKGYELVTEPLTWRPVAGEELVVAVGLAGEDSFIVALYRLPEGRFRVASSLVLKKDKGPIVVAYDRSVATRLEWSTAWQRPGESGRITYRDDGRVIITQE